MRLYGLTVLRVFVAVVFIERGIEQLFGGRGGGLADTVVVVTRLHLPAAYPLAVGAAAAELACGILLLAGAFTLWAIVVLLTARVALFCQAYLGSGVFIPRAQPARTDFELSVLLIGGLLALLLSGPGALSLDDRRLRTAERASAARARIRAGKM